ncbi:MAG: hypothetical protein KAR20_28125, partial [Candidatus Heimdallarchaeota archaeon]|nr:hypothetical protein [Candidatus Heimdallarchaeota archaeon]
KKGGEHWYSTNKNISEDGKWIMNPGRKNTYFEEQIFYGSRSGEPQVHKVGNAEIFYTNADYIMTEPPSSVSTKSSSEVRTVLKRASDYVDENSEDFVLSEDVERIKALEEELEKGKTLLDEHRVRIENYQKRLKEFENMPIVPDEMKTELNWLIDKEDEDVNAHNDLLDKIKKKYAEYETLIYARNSTDVSP